MNAGRELDALVAEKVMGWKLLGVNGIDGCFAIVDGNSTSFALPKYSTDIAAAKEVADKVGLVFKQYENGWAAGEAGHMAKADGAIPQWIEMHPILRCAKTAPHAICLAALKTVGIEGGWY